MLNDDDTIGRILSRREALALLGASGVALLAGRPLRAQQPSTGRVCVVRPEQTEGPYFVDERLHRADIRSDPTNGVTSVGLPLTLAFSVARLAADRCVPLAGAYVDVWQCDAAGVYSGVRDPQFDTSARKFLRGYQVTDAEGMARFTTIYPGWYPGRAVHIHFKVRSAPDARPGFEFTSQVYFDEAVTDAAHARAPYAVRGTRTVRNDRDGIFRRQGGKDLMLDVRTAGDGYAGTFALALTT